MIKGQNTKYEKQEQEKTARFSLKILEVSETTSNCIIHNTNRYNNPQCYTDCM